MSPSNESHTQAPPASLENGFAPRTLQQRNDSLPPIWNIRERRNAHFAGREEQLAAITEHLNELGLVIINEETPPIGGVGKSQLAREYAYRHANDYQVVWWVQAEESGVLHFTYPQLLSGLSLLTGVADEPTHSVESVRTYLSEHSGWLLVLDGVYHLETLHDLLPTVRAGHIIVTAPVGAASADYPCVPLAPFGDAESAEYLSHHVPAISPEEIDAITAQIDHHPLILNLFAGFMTATKMKPGKALETLYAKTPEPMQGKVGPEVSKGMLRVLVQLILDRLKKEDRACNDLAKLCAFLAPHDIPLFLLSQENDFLSKRLAECLSSTRTREKCLATLAAFGLVEIHDDSFSMHESVQEAIRESLTRESRDAWTNAAVRLIIGVYPFQQEYPTPIPECTRLVAHSLMATQYAEEADVARESTAHLLYYTGLYLHGRGAYADAKTCYLLSITLGHRVFGAAHPSFATRINSLGIVEHQLGNLKEAKDCFEKAFEICEAVFGPLEEAVYSVEDEAMLTMPIRNLCAVLEELGDMDSAQSTYERAMKIYLQVYGWNHPMVAECANRFGRAWHHLGRLAKARNCFEKAVLAEESAAESDTTRLALYLNNLGTVLVEMEQPQLAHERFTHALRLDKQNFGDTDAVIGRDLYHLGNSNRLLQRFKEAEDCYKKALTILEASEDEDQNLPALLSHLGIVLVEKGDPAVARLHLERALGLNQERFGKDAPELVRDLTNLGRALEALEVQSQAMACFRRALGILEKTEDEEGAKHATIYYRMGRLLHTSGELAEAQTTLQKAMKIDNALYGEQNPAVARDAYAIGCVLADMDDTVVAMGHLTLALDIYENTMGKDSARARKVRRRLDELA